MLKRRTFYSLLFLLITFGFLVLLAWCKPEWLYLNAKSNSQVQVSERQENYFAIKQVAIEGDNPFVSQIKIKNTLMHYVKDNFFDINLEKTIDSLNTLPGIKAVSIRRVWPDKLLVSLESEKAFAKSINNNWLINPNGELFETDIPIKQQLPVFIAPSGGLPQVVDFYREISPKLKSVTLIITKLQLLATGDWEVFVSPLGDQYLKDPRPFIIQLGHRSMRSRANNFIKIYKSGNFLETKKGKIGPKIVNMQYQNGFSVQWYG